MSGVDTLARDGESLPQRPQRAPSVVGEGFAPVLR